jgi:GAF domain-containing protein
MRPRPSTHHLAACSSDFYTLSRRVANKNTRLDSRTGEEIVEENLSTSMAYGGDPYCLKTRSKSVMCLPIKRFSQVAGVIYLENNLAAGVFTRERSRFVRMLGVQVIISIDNARLYQGLGLSSSHDIIVGAHRGTMHVESVEGEFAEFILTIPRLAPAQSKQQTI